jgi:DNA-binding IclR family transcriptional regulator
MANAANRKAKMIGAAPNMSSKEPSAGTQAINRAFAILRLLRDVETPLSLSEIGAGTQLHMSTVHRILRALLDAGYVAQLADDRYCLGDEVYFLGEAAKRALNFDLVMPVLENIRKITRESVNLVIRRGGAARVAACRVLPPFALQPASWEGHTAALHKFRQGHPGVLGGPG